MESNGEIGFKGTQLFRGGRLRVTSMTLTGEQDIPMHDHPYARGVLLVIFGVVEITVCKKMPQTMASPYSRLQLLSRRRLFPGGLSRISQREGNIHAIRTLSTKCVLLDVMFHERTNTLRNWFFPAHQTGHQEILARTITRKYLPNVDVITDQESIPNRQGGNDEKKQIFSR